MGVDRKLPPKREVALALLQASMVSVYLDPRGEQVCVPQWFKKQPQLMLQIGLNMPVPIPDLDVGDEALTCTLSFNRRPEFCRIPWASIYALVGEDGRGMIWPEDVPPEVAAQAEGRASAPKTAGHLRAVPKEAEGAEATAKEAEEVAAKNAKASPAGGRTSQEKRKKRAQRAAAGRKTPPKAAEPRMEEAEKTARGEARKGKRELPSYLRVVK